MRLSEEGIIFLITIVIFPLLFFGGMGVISLQQNKLFQETYAKNMECRTAMKGSTSDFIEKICGKIPEYKEFVRNE